MLELKFLADMNISPLTVRKLRSHGYSIIRVSDILPANSSDRTILTLAQHDDFIVVTQDLDFSTLVAISGQTVPSLITLRMSDSSPESVTNRLLAVLPDVMDTLQQ